MLSNQSPPLFFFNYLRKPIVLIPIMAVLSSLLGWYVGNGGQDAFWLLVTIAAGIVIGLITFSYPYLGLAILIGSLSLESALPSTPLLTSSTAALGALTFGCYVLHVLKRDPALPAVKFTQMHFFALAFIFWLFVSNPNAAVFASDRNWAWTFIQLFALFFLSSVLLRQKNTHDPIMLIIGGAAAVSALVALFSDSGELVGETILLRSGGLTGINAAARYFTAALVMLTYALQLPRPMWQKFLIVIGLFVLTAGIVATGSRSGFVIAAFSVVLVLVIRGSGNYRWRFLLIATTLLIVVAIAPEAYWTRILSSQDSIAQGTDTVGTRYELWQAGTEMWKAHPMQGIGVGQFPLQLSRYAPGILIDRSAQIGPHSMYVAVLSETGTVGAILFGLLIVTALGTLIKAYRRSEGHDRQLVTTWLIILLSLLVGGITKHDQYDKLFWFVLGAASTFVVAMQTEKRMAIAEGQTDTL